MWNKHYEFSVKGRTMAKSTTMLLFAVLLVPFLLSDEESYEYEPGIDKCRGGEEEEMLER